MRKLTIKDFIHYNNPCFSCGRKISVKVGSYRPLERYAGTPDSVIYQDHIDIDLHISYTSSLKLKIFNQTNKFLTNNPQRFISYLREHRIFLKTICDCHTVICTTYFDFNLDKGFIKPFIIDKELIVVEDNDNIYYLYSVYEDNKTFLEVTKKDTLMPTRITINLPLTPLSKFKSREHFFNKMKTYLTFS